MNHNGKDVAIYVYARGDKFSCKVAIINNEFIIFDDIKYPPTTSEAVIERLLVDAEKEAWKQHNTEKQEEKSWMNSQS